MGSKINSSSLALTHNLRINKAPNSPPAMLLRFKRSTPRATSSSSSSTSPSKQQDSPAGGVKAAHTVEFETLEACKLGISRYPDFEYNARGGSGTAVVGRATEDGALPVSFDVETIYIPPLTSATTKFLGLPLPPFLEIAIAPEVFQGTIGRASGKVELRFRAKFSFSAGSVYRAPPLLVETTLTSEESKGEMREGRGKRMDVGGQCKLVGVSVVDPIDDILMNTFLGLPTECIAILNAKITIAGPC